MYHSNILYKINQQKLPKCIKSDGSATNFMICEGKNASNDRNIRTISKMYVNL